jgi:hypothetical protein
METSSHTGKVRIREKMALLVLVFVLVFGVSAILLIYSFRKPIPNIVLLPLEEESHSRLRIQLDDWSSWFRSYLFGPGRIISLTTSMMDFEGFSIPSDFGLPKPDFVTRSGLEIWILKGAELGRLCQTIDKLPRRREISLTNTAIVSKNYQPIASGGRFSGAKPGQIESSYRFNASAFLRDRDLDLTVGVSVIEHPELDYWAVKTNLDIRARIQVPSGNGVLLLNTEGAKASGRSIVVLLSPSVK